MKFIFILCLFLWSILGFAQFNDAQKAYLSRDNRLVNSGFEEGTSSKFYTTSGS